MCDDGSSISGSGSIHKIINGGIGRHIRQKEKEKALRLENKMDTLKSTRLTAKTDQTMTGIRNRKNDIRGGNSDTHRDCVSCLDGPRTLPNSKFCDTQLHFSNVRIRCQACVSCRRQKINVTDHQHQLDSTHHRDCNKCGLFLLVEDFSTNELLLGKSKMICKSCCILIPERAKYRNDLLRIIAAKVRVCTVCGCSKPKRYFRWKELGLHNRLTITCLLCTEPKMSDRQLLAQQEKYHLKSLSVCAPSQQHYLQLQYQHQIQKQQFQQQHHGQIPYQYQINQQHAYNDNQNMNTKINGAGAIHSCQVLQQQQYRSGNNYAVHQQQPQLQPEPSEINNSNNKTKNKINKYAYGHLQYHPHHRATTKDNYVHVPQHQQQAQYQQHVLPPTSSLVSSSRSNSNTKPTSNQQLSPTSTSFTPTKRSGTSKPKSKLLSPTSTSFIPANGLTIDELLKGMTTVRIEQQPDEDRTYVVYDDDKSIQTTTTAMAMLYPPQPQNKTLLVGCHNSINNNKYKNKEEDDITTTTVATTTLSSTITPNDAQQQDSTNNNYGGGGDGRREGIESFLLGSLLDLDDGDSNEESSIVRVV